MNEEEKNKYSINCQESDNIEVSNFSSNSIQNSSQNISLLNPSTFSLLNTSSMTGSVFRELLFPSKRVTPLPLPLIYPFNSYMMRYYITGNIDSLYDFNEKGDEKREIELTIEKIIEDIEKIQKDESSESCDESSQSDISLKEVDLGNNIPKSIIDDYMEKIQNKVYDDEKGGDEGDNSVKEDKDEEEDEDDDENNGYECGWVLIENTYT